MESMNLRNEFNAALRATGSDALIIRFKPSSVKAMLTDVLLEGISLASGIIDEYRISASSLGR